MSSGLGQRHTSNLFQSVQAICLGVAILIMAAGCAPHLPVTPPITPALSSPPAPTPVKPPILIALTPPSPARQLANTVFRIELTDPARRKPIDGAQVNVRLSMPSMFMPQVDVACPGIGGGYYSGTGTFTMAGDWAVAVRVRTSDGRNATLLRTVHVE
jgi:hypothetical protein